MAPILVATDLTERGDLAVARGAALAEQWGVPLRLAHVVEDDRPNEDVLADEAQALDWLQAQLAALDKLDATASVETGHPAILIPRLARQMDACLVVFGTHRNRGIADWVGRPNLVRLLGGLEHAALVVVLPHEQAYENAVIGWDFTAASAHAAEKAAALFPDVVQCLAHAVAPMPLAGASPTASLADLTATMTTGQLEALAEAGAARGVEVISHPGSPSTALVSMAQTRDAQLIAVGRHKRGALERMVLGETAMSLALHSPCDLLIAPPLP